MNVIWIMVLCSESKRLISGSWWLFLSNLIRINFYIISENTQNFTWVNTLAFNFTNRRHFCSQNTVCYKQATAATSARWQSSANTLFQARQEQTCCICLCTKSCDLLNQNISHNELTKSPVMCLSLNAVTEINTCRLPQSVPLADTIKPSFWNVLNLSDSLKSWLSSSIPWRYFRYPFPSNLTADSATQKHENNQKWTTDRIWRETTVRPFLCYS